MSNLFNNLKIFPLKAPVGSLVGNGQVEVAGVVTIRFTIVKGPQGIFASLPSRKGTKPDDNGKIPYYPEVSIIDKGNYEEFQQIVKKEFVKALGAKGNGAGGNGKVVKKNNNKAGEEDQTEDYEDGCPF